MSNAKPNNINPMVVGLEFERLTHWDRFILNQNIARMERQIYPEPSNHLDVDDETDLWRGERRNFYRLDIQKIEFFINLDLGTTRGIYLENIPVLNLSPAGCCILVPPDTDFQPGTRIPRLTFPFGDEELIIRAKVVHTAVMDVNTEFRSNCL